MQLWDSSTEGSTQGHETSARGERLLQCMQGCCRLTAGGAVAARAGLLARSPRLAGAPPAATARYRSWVGEETRPEASRPMRARSPTGLTWPSHSGWKRALV